MPAARLGAVLVLILVLLGAAGCRRSSAPLPEGEKRAPEGTAAGDEGAAPTGPGAAAPPLPGGVLVVVENHPDARPQSGLDRADVVFEADIVAGITRLLALYHSRPADEIGPVRSARWCFYDLARGYGLPFAHAGAGADVLAELARARRRGFPDLDEIYGAGGYFWRDWERRMPHNLYTSTELLVAGARARGYPLRAPAPLSSAAGDPPPGAGEPAGRVRVPFREGPGERNVVTWEYRDGRYVRFLNGQPHAMKDGALIRAANVVLLVTDTQTVVKGGEPVKENRVTGEGDAVFFTGGRAYRGRWSKPDAGDTLRLLYGDGEMPLAPGPTWVEIVGKDVRWSFGPAGAAAGQGEAGGDG